LHIEALVKQYGDAGGLDSCDIIREYRGSTRSLDAEDEALCSDDKTIQVQTKFQTCSHSTSTSVYQTIQDLTNVKIISEKLCKALTTIGFVCVKQLKECFSEDDVRQMRKSHLEEMIDFLLRIVQGKAPSNALDNCKLALDIDDSIDSIEYSYDEEEDYVPEVDSKEVTSTINKDTETNDDKEQVDETKPIIVTSSTFRAKESRTAEFIAADIDTTTEGTMLNYKVIKSTKEISTDSSQKNVSDETEDTTKISVENDKVREVGRTSLHFSGGTNGTSSARRKCLPVLVLVLVLGESLARVL